MLHFAIADINFIIHSSDIPLLIEPQNISYVPFITKNPVTANGALTVNIVLKTEEPPSIGEMTEIFEDCGSWSMMKKGNEYYLVLNPSLPEGPECIVRFGPGLEEAMVYCGKPLIVEAAGKRMIRNPFLYPFDQLLLMYVLAENKGALIHSSGVNFNNCGCLFAGRSGAGKSTLSRKFASAGHEVLSDDRIAVRKIDGKFRIFGTPWSGEAGIAKNKNLPLHSIFFIHHAEKNHIKKLSPAEAIERLLPVTSIPWYDEDTLTKLFNFCEELVSDCPAFDLFFRADISVQDTLQKFIPD